MSYDSWLNEGLDDYMEGNSHQVTSQCQECGKIYNGVQFRCTCGAFIDDEGDDDE